MRRAIRHAALPDRDQPGLLPGADILPWGFDRDGMGSQGATSKQKHQHSHGLCG